MYTITIDNTKGINHLEFQMPENQGVYLLTGENGSGKTTLMVAINRMGNPTALTSLKVGRHMPNTYAIDTYNNSKITYSNGAETVTYTRQDVRWVPRPRSNSKLLDNFPYHNRMTFITTSGMRFYTQDFDTINSHEVLNDASQNMKESLNSIFQTNKFNNLKYVTIRNMHGRQKSLHRNNKLYLINEGPGRKYSEQNFSLGERLVLNVLDDVETLGDNSMLLVDEIELALHPIAQVKFYDLLSRLANEHHLIVIISTHSVSLINHASNILYLKKEDNGNINVLKDCRPAYILKNIGSEQDIKPDFVFFVEDKMARLYLTPILRRLIATTSLPINYQVVPVGGYEQFHDLGILLYRHCRVV